MAEDRTDELRELLERLAKKHEIVGAAVGVLTGDRRLYAATGTANRDTGVEVTTDTIFQIGSITKVYTATLVMQLVDEGTVDLDEPVTNYLPDLEFGAAPEGRAVTVRQLLSHTSGVFGDHFADFGRGDDAIERYAASCADLGKVHEPGETMSYCNAGYNVLGRLVEVLRETPWHEALTQHLTDPLGANDTVSLPEEAIMRRVAVGHMVDPQDPEAGVDVAPQWTLSPASAPAGALTCATIEDLLRFGGLHLREGRNRDGEQVLSPESAKMMRQVQVELPSTATLGAHAWGLGWILFDWDGHDVIGHDGATLGQASTLRIAPGEDLIVSVLTNGGKVRGFLHEMTATLFDELADVAVPEETSPLDDPSSVDVSRYTGTYGQETAGYHFHVRDRQLLLDIEPRSEHAKQLVPELEDVAVRPAGGDDFVAEIMGQPSTISFFAFNGDDRPRFAHVGFRALPRESTG